MSFHRKSWKVRTLATSIGYFENTAIPNWPGKTPNPKASSGSLAVTASLSRLNPDWMPVFDGATYRYG